MEKFLSIIEISQQKALINEEKLKFFICNVSICDHFGITENAYKSSMSDEKKNMLNRYYSELYRKYYGAGKDFSFLLFGQIMVILNNNPVTFISIKKIFQRTVFSI